VSAAGGSREDSKIGSRSKSRSRPEKQKQKQKKQRGPGGPRSSPRSTRVADEIDEKRKKRRTEPGRPARRRLSRSKAAVAARRRRAHERGVRDQLAHEREERDERRRARRRERAAGPDIRRLAVSWLEEIRNIVAGVVRCSLDLTQPEAGARTFWIVVGRYDLLDPAGYVELARALDLVRSDLGLEAAIHPQRLSQIRVVYRDPRGRRGEGDSIVSKIGAWEFIMSDLLFELVGSGVDDRDSLAVRYAETGVPTFYVYFSPDLVRHSDPWHRMVPA
jgi:hypothetical protein